MEGILAFTLGGLIIFFFFMSYAILSRIVKGGPHEALIISGMKRFIRNEAGQRFMVGFRILKGGRTFVWPFLERLDRLSLELMTVNTLIPNVLTGDLKHVNVDVMASVKIQNSDIGIARAAENYLSKTPEQIGESAGLIIESAVRNILGRSQSTEMYGGREELRKKLVDETAVGLDKVGIEVVSYAIRDLHEISA